MDKPVYRTLFFILLFFCSTDLAAKNPGVLPGKSFSGQQQDSLQKLQILYNGKVWRNLYMRVVGNQFLFSAQFLKGSVTMNGKRFDGLPMLYDIYDDEILMPGSDGTIIRLNKEMVDSFTLTYNLKRYRFEKVDEDTVRGFNGYVNILFKGRVMLYLKYRKDIAILAVDDKYDKFYDVNRIYFMKNGEVHQVKNRRDLFIMMEDHKAQLKNYMRKNGLHVLKKDPSSFIPVVKYYDTLLN
jgi:hypothetical protein